MAIIKITDKTGVIDDAVDNVTVHVASNPILDTYRNFRNLNDTPKTNKGQNGKIPVVNESADCLEYKSISEIADKVFLGLKDSSENTKLFGGIEKERFIYGKNKYGVMQSNNFHVNDKSGFIESYNGTNCPIKDTWIWGWQTSHSHNKSNVHYGAQLVVAQNENAYFRVQNSNGAGTWHKVMKEDVANTLFAKKNGDKLQDFSARAIYFPSQSTDKAYIKSTISGTSTNLDFFVSDDSSGNDRFRFRFQPSGKDEFSIMEMYDDSKSSDSLGVVLVNGQLKTMGALAEYGKSLSERYLGKNSKAVSATKIEDNGMVVTPGSGNEVNFTSRAENVYFNYRQMGGVKIKKFVFGNGDSNTKTAGDIVAGNATFLGEVKEFNTKLSELYVNHSLKRGIYQDITVEGDADTFYPVIFESGTSGHDYMQLDISRTFNWPAPSTWNTAVHRGGLTLSIRWSGDTGWGGNDLDMRVDKFDETYSRMVGGLKLTTSGILVYLRGGGAKYRIRSTNGKKTRATVMLKKFVSASKTEYLPRSMSEIPKAVDDEVYTRCWNRDGKLYDQNARVYSANNKPSANDISAVALNAKTSNGYTWLTRKSDTDTVFYVSQQGAGRIAEFRQGDGSGTVHTWIENDGTIAMKSYSATDKTTFGRAGAGSWCSNKRGAVTIHTHKSGSTAHPFLRQIVDGTQKGVFEVLNSGRVWKLFVDGAHYDFESTGFHSSQSIETDKDLTAKGNISEYSDKRIKSNIKVISDALDKIDKLRGVTYTRDDLDNISKTGVIAQELQKVLPEAVTEQETEDLETFKDGKVLSVAYGQTIGLLIEGIKEEKRNRESLEKELSDLKKLVQSVIQ